MSHIVKIVSIVFFTLLVSVTLVAETKAPQGDDPEVEANLVSPYSTQDYRELLSSRDGRLYAYTVLLYNNNPHFLNVIENRLVISAEEDEYSELFLKYIHSLPKNERSYPERMLRLYNRPYSFSEEQITELESGLEKHGIIAKFIMEKGEYSLDYCIFGSKDLITIEHPFLISNHDIYCIQPVIHYDEFYSSNSTFYHDLVYIDQSEVKNDAEILKALLNDEILGDKYYVGAQVTKDMVVCAKKAFTPGMDIEGELQRIFVIHEMTHKIINNRFNYYNRIVEEELAIASTTFANPFLGLSVVYSYLNYPYVDSPHRIAALKFMRFASEETGDPSFLYNPSKLSLLSADQLRLMAYRYFYRRMELVDRQRKNRSALRSLR